MSRKVYEQLKQLTTESPNPLSANLDELSIRETLELINSEDQKIPDAVRRVIPQIEPVIERIVASFRQGGRLIYAGAGTSGRLGVLDASECPPTFGVNPTLVQGIIAGGRRTLVRSREGVEDDIAAAHGDIEKLHPDSMDTVIGIAASGRTPYPLKVLQTAKAAEATTVFLVCNQLSKLPDYIDLVINPVLGPEVLTGSTRMKAGTACKLILNMLTTTAMVQIGKCYGNLMVDLNATSEKLAERSKRILVELLDISYGDAESLLKEARGEVKTALAMKMLDLGYQTARRRLREANGHLAALISASRRQI